MKEAFVPITTETAGVRLTTPVTHPRLEREGNIFMAEGTGGMDQAPQGRIPDYVPAKITPRPVGGMHQSLEVPIPSAVFRAKAHAEGAQLMKALGIPPAPSVGLVQSEEMLQKTLVDQPEGTTAAINKQRSEQLESEKAAGRKPETAMAEPPRPEDNIRTRIHEVFADPQVNAQLISPTPDFNNLEKLDNLLKLIAPSDRYFPIFVEELINKDIDMHTASRRLLFEWALEKIIGIPDLTPDAPYSEQFGFTITGIKDEVLGIGRLAFGDEANEDFVKYFSQLPSNRGISHELSRSISSGETYKRLIAEQLRGHGLDFLQNRIAGVNEAVALYEKINHLTLAEHHEWFLSDTVNKIERNVQDYFKDLHDLGELTVHGRRLTKWELDRALLIGKAVFAGTQRRAMYAATGDIPAVGTRRNESLPDEYIARTVLGSNKIISGRWWNNLPGSRHFMEESIKEQMALDRTIDNGKLFNLFGLNEQTNILNSWNGVDMESHGWRAQLLYYGNLLVKGDDGEITDLLSYFNNRIPEFYTPAQIEAGVFIEGDPRDKNAFSNVVADAVYAQRLYLSPLAQYGLINDDLKTAVYEKMAILKPSSIAAFLDGEWQAQLSPSDKLIWDEMKKDLVLAEHIRTNRDSQKIDEYRTLTEKIKNGETLSAFDAATLAVLRAEYDAEVITFKELHEGLREGVISGDYKLDQIKDIFKEIKEKREETMSADEKNILDRLVDWGMKTGAQRMVKQKMSFIYCIDDARHTSWVKPATGEAGSADEDVLRRLAGDQPALAEGWGEVGKALFDPTSPHVLENLAKAVEKIGSINGELPTQQAMEAFVIAWLKMASTYEHTLWTPGAKTVSGITKSPTSAMEQFYRRSFISLDEEGRNKWLLAAAQLKVIGSGIDSHGVIQLESIEKKTKSHRARLMIRWLRLMMMILPPVMFAEFVKTVAPLK